MMEINESIFKEAYIFRDAFFTGVLLVLAYDFFRIIRRLIPHGNIWISIEDFIFWVSSAIVIFLMLYRENSGYLRGFCIIAVVLGMFLYSCILSKYVIAGIVWLFQPFLKVCRWMRRKIIRAVHIFKKALKKIYRAIKMSAKEEEKRE